MIARIGRFAKQSSLLWAAEVGGVGLRLVTIALLGRFYGPEILGTYLSIVALAQLLPRILDLGLPLAIGYFVRVYPDRLASCMRISALHVLISTPFAMGLAALLMLVPFEAGNATEVVDRIWWVLGIYVVAELSCSLARAAFIPRMQFGAYMSVMLVPLVLLAAAVTLHEVAFPGTVLGPATLIELLTASSVIAALLAGGIVLHTVKRGEQLQLDGGDMYRYGSRTYVSGLAKVASQRFDRIFLTMLLGASAFAQYSVALSLREMIIFPANLLALTLRNQQIDLVAHKRDVARARRLLLRVSAIAAGAATAIATLLAPVWGFIVPLIFGDGFSGAAHFITVLAFSCPFLAIVSFAWNHLYAMKRPGRVTILTCVSLVLAAPTFAIAVTLFGRADGAAVAAVIWAAMVAVGSFVWAWRTTPLTPAGGQI